MTFFPACKKFGGFWKLHFKDIRKCLLSFFYSHFIKLLFQHRSSFPQDVHNLASSVSWHHVDKVWCELLVSSWRSMNEFAA